MVVVIEGVEDRGLEFVEGVDKETRCDLKCDSGSFEQEIELDAGSDERFDEVQRVQSGNARQLHWLQPVGLRVVHRYNPLRF